LMYAAAANRNAAQMVKLLLSKRADVKPRALYSDWPSQVTSEPRAQYRSVGGLTALLYAARSGCYECVQDMIAAGADVNVPTPEGITPLMIALDNQHNDVAKLLMDKGANLDVWDWWGRTALWIAVDRKGDGAAGRGFGRGGFGGGRGAGGGGRGAAAPVAANVSRGPAVSSMEIIHALLNAGVDPDVEMNFHRPNAPNRGRFADNQVSTGTTALFRAVQNNDLEAAQALLEKGADPNINSMGYTAFLLAAGAGPAGRGGTGGGQPNMRMLDMMVQHAADVNAQVTGTKLYSFNVSRDAANNNGIREGASALSEAARNLRTEVVKYLLDHGADPNLADRDGKKPIDVVGIPRPVRGFGQAPAGAAGQAEASPAAAGAAPGAGRGRGAARVTANPAAVAEIRAMLEAAAKK
jgi:ankyrin repeat protein